MLTKVTSGSIFRFDCTHVTPINVRKAKENIPASRPRGRGAELKKEVCVSDLNTSDFMESASIWGTPTGEVPGLSRQSNISYLAFGEGQPY